MIGPEQIETLATTQIQIETYIAALHAPESEERTKLLADLANDFREALIMTGRMCIAIADKRDVPADVALAGVPENVRRMAALYGVRFGEETQS